MVRAGFSVVEQGALLHISMAGYLHSKHRGSEEVELVAALGAQQIMQQLDVFEAAFERTSQQAELFHLLLEPYAGFRAGRVGEQVLQRFRRGGSDSVGISHIERPVAIVDGDAGVGDGCGLHLFDLDAAHRRRMENLGAGTADFVGNLPHQANQGREFI